MNAAPDSLPHVGSAKRRIRCLIAYLSPFRIVEADQHSTWKCTIDQVNNRSWDYVALHEMVGGLDVGLPNPYHLVVSRDGALALPPVDKLLALDKSVEFFNRCLAALLIGGVYSEAISSDGLDVGFILDWKYIRSTHAGAALSNRFHKHVRYSQASPLDAISLFEPRTVQIEQLASALKIGLFVLNCVPRLRGDILLKGVTGYARRDWPTCLSHSWIIIEQLLSHIWESMIVSQSGADGLLPSRRNQLQDNRTWTSAVKIEVFLQKGIITATQLNDLSAARKARNDLSHEGTTPSETSAQAAFRGMKHLLEIAMPNFSIPLFSINLSDHTISDPFQPNEIRHEPRFWMPIPKLPGEQELERLQGREEAERHDDSINK